MDNLQEIPTGCSSNPEEPGSQAPAPPTLSFNSTNLFAFGASSSSDFFSSLRQKGEAAANRSAYNQDETADKSSNANGTNGESVSYAAKTTVRQAFAGVPISAIPSRRKNSIEMFLSQSPSQALGGEFMKMNFKHSSTLDAPESTISETGYYTSNDTPFFESESTPTSAPRGVMMVPNVQWPVPGSSSSGNHNTAVAASVASPAVAPVAKKSIYSNTAADRRSNNNSTGGNGNSKQCKFFAQGHCRMGAKCKFAHVDGSSTTGGNSSSNTTNAKQSYGSTEQQSRGGSSSRRSTQSHTTTPQAMYVSQSEEGSITPMSLEEVKGRVFVMSKDQNGCRMLQEQLCQDRTEMHDLIFEESLSHLPEMMVDPFGNYLFQKLLERVTEPQRTSIVKRVSANLVPAALNLHGTRSVQKVVEVCTDPDQLEVIVEALREDAVRLCIDSNGNHVIQRALQHMRPEDNQFVFDAVAKECTTVGTHRHGCCVLQRCLDAANKQQKTAVISQVEINAMKLMQDPYGNYVVQYVLDSCSPLEAAGVIRQPLGHIFELSIQKFSSNVIEKCLEKASLKTREAYLIEIMNCHKLNRMLQDQFANYVVQRALSVCTDEHGLMLVNAIRPHLPGMKNTSGGRRITARILKRFPNMNLDLPEYPEEVSPLTSRDMNRYDVNNTSSPPRAYSCSTEYSHFKGTRNGSASQVQGGGEEASYQHQRG